MLPLIPKAFFLTRSIGVHKEQLTAFELALRDADIEHQNLVTVSSILPPGCVELEKDAGVATLHPGEITFAVMARTETNEAGRRTNASIGLARPSDPSLRNIMGMAKMRSRAATMRKTLRQPC